MFSIFLLFPPPLYWELSSIFDFFLLFISPVHVNLLLVPGGRFQEFLSHSKSKCATCSSVEGSSFLFSPPHLPFPSQYSWHNNLSALLPVIPRVFELPGHVVHDSQDLLLPHPLHIGVGEAPDHLVAQDAHLLLSGHGAPLWDEELCPHLLLEVHVVDGHVRFQPQAAVQCWQSAVLEVLLNLCCELQVRIYGIHDRGQDPYHPCIHWLSFSLSFLIFTFILFTPDKFMLLLIISQTFL